MTTQDTPATTRRCHGSARFGFEPHEAPTSSFPKQPSRKDGLGVMCTEHWKAYVKGLRQARIAGAGAGSPVDESATKANAKPAANADEAAKAEALIAEVDALPAERMAQRVGDADVQAALETSASVRIPSA